MDAIDIGVIGDSLFTLSSTGILTSNQFYTGSPPCSGLPNPYRQILPELATQIITGDKFGYIKTSTGYLGLENINNGSNEVCYICSPWKHPVPEGTKYIACSGDIAYFASEDGEITERSSEGELKHLATMKNIRGLEAGNGFLLILTD